MIDRIHRGSGMRDDLRGAGQRGEGGTGPFPVQPRLDAQEPKSAEPSIDVEPDDEVGSPIWLVSCKPNAKPECSRDIPEAIDRRVHDILAEPTGEGSADESNKEESERAVPRDEEILAVWQKVREVRRMHAPKSGAAAETSAVRRQSRLQPSAQSFQRRGGAEQDDRKSGLHGHGSPHTEQGTGNAQSQGPIGHGEEASVT